MKISTILLLISTVFSIETAPFTSFVIGFWPEYDHPGVLVTFEVAVPPDQLPVKLGVTLPLDASMALHSQDTPGGEKELVNQSVTTIEGENRMLLDIDQEQYYAQLYYNPFDSTTFRQFDFDLKFDQNIDSAYVVIQQNLAGSNFQSNLTNIEAMTDEYGFVYNRQLITNLPAGSPYRVSFSYENSMHQNSLDIIKEKMADHPPMDMGETAEGAGAQTGSSTETSLRQSRYIVTFGLPLLLIGFVIVLKIKSRKTPAERPAAKPEGKKYCTSCGHPIELNTKFCTKCGKDLHVS